MTREEYPIDLPGRYRIGGDVATIEIGPPRDHWEYRALGIAQQVSTWSSCTRDRVGACVMTLDHDEFILGFNDTPSGSKNCFDGGCPRADRLSASGSPQLDDELCLHAEDNALQRAGLRTRGAILAVTRRPCATCYRRALAGGIAYIVLEDS